MDKIDSLYHLRDILNEIFRNMSEISGDIEEILKCIREKTRIKKEISDKVIEYLKKITDTDDECEQLCSRIGIEKGEDLKKVYEEVSEELEILRLKSTISRYERFLRLEAGDKETEKLLVPFQISLKKILDNYTDDMKEEAENYASFVDMLLEKDDTRKTAYICDLSSVFGNELLGKAVFSHSIRLPEEDDDTANKASTTDNKEFKTENDIAEVHESAANEAAAASEAENAVSDHNSDNEDVDFDSAAKNELLERGLIVTDKVFNGTFYIKNSSSEKKKPSTKSFVKDVATKYPRVNTFAVGCIDNYNSVISELVASIAEVRVEDAELSLEYLQAKGYIREYVVNGIGSFHCLSPKGLRVLSSKDVRANFKLHGKKYDNKFLEDKLPPVLTRMAYAKVSAELLKNIKEEDKGSFCSLNEECFAIKLKEKKTGNVYVAVGGFWSVGHEAYQHIKSINEHCLQEKCACFIVSGINADMAKGNADYYIDKLGLDVSKVYCFALVENTFTAYNSAEKLKIADLFVSEDDEPSGENNIIEEDISKAEYIEKNSEPKTAAEDSRNISNADKKAENDEYKKSDANEKKFLDPEKERLEKKNRKEPKANTLSENGEMSAAEENILITKSDTPLNEEDMMTNVYNMIISGKTYCASTYLRSLKDSSAAADEMYKRLAYAVNVPCMRCSYNSQTIFSIYSAGTDVFSGYLMAAASLRSFFTDQTGYDHGINELYNSVKNISAISKNNALANAANAIAVFKKEIHKGIDFYADYRVKDQVAMEKSFENFAKEAKSYYDSYIKGKPKNYKSVIRFVDTWKLIFPMDGDFAVYLDAIISKDFSFADMARDYLAENFIFDNCTVEYSNLDKYKLNDFIDCKWDEAAGRMRNRYKTSKLMSGLRNNLISALEKVIKLICSWTLLAEKRGNAGEDNGSKRYKEVKTELEKNLRKAKRDIETRSAKMQSEEKAGAVVLTDTISEFISRLDGSYDEKLHKYYYIDFLRGNYVLLDNEFLPDMKGKFVDFKELSLENRVLRHSAAQLMTFEDKLHSIFEEYGDDYGSAGLIMTYLNDIEKGEICDKYDLEGSEKIAKEEAQMRLSEFIENLELARSYGQIEETSENKKEKILRIANEWFEYAKSSGNYGFFRRILKKYEEKIREDAKLRGKALSAELEGIRKSIGSDERMKKRIERINEMIQSQNYTVAEDLISRFHKNEPDELSEANDIDYLRKFIDEYSYNYNKVADTSRSIATLVRLRERNKESKAGGDIINCWMSNGGRMDSVKIQTLLEKLGFSDLDVKEEEKIGKIENYIVKTNKNKKGGDENYKHPISAFGSRAAEEGFRVICLMGRYNADSLIEAFKNIHGIKNTLVLLDYALPLTERRRLARKIKSEMGNQVFAVIDRVLLMFLANNYNVMFINQMLMYTMMPFSYFQPYVSESSKVMPPEIFMGRKNELEDIKKSEGANIVYGGRQLGKSTLLKMAKRSLNNDKDGNRAVFVDIKKLDYKEAALKVSRSLYDEGILTEDINTDDWSVLARAVKVRLNSDKPKYIPYLLLLLDEADSFIESCAAVDYAPFDELKDIQNVGQNRFKFVVAGLHNIYRFNRDRALSNNIGLTHLKHITIKPFEGMEARQLLEIPLKYMGLRFSDDKQSMLSLILASTNYFPGLIQLYCAKLIESMRKDDYAGYDESSAPVYEVSQNHIKKVLADPEFTEQIKEKFVITLRLDEDNMYHIIALLMADLYHQNANSAYDTEGFSASNIIDAANEYGIRKVADQTESNIDGYMQELCELNILRQTVNGMYLFLRYSFFQMMGRKTEIEDNLLEYMEE